MFQIYVCEVGDFDQGRPFMEQFLVTPVSIPTVSGYVAMVIPLFSRITGVVSQLDMVKEAAEVILSSASSTPASVSRARAGLGLLAVQENDLAGALEQYAALGSSRGTMLWWLISADRC